MLTICLFQNHFWNSLVKLQKSNISIARAVDSEALESFKMGQLGNVFLLCLIFMLYCDLNFSDDFETAAAFSFLSLTDFPSFYSK